MAGAPASDAKPSTRQGKDSFAAVLDGVTSAQASAETPGADKQTASTGTETAPTEMPSPISAVAALEYFLTAAAAQTTNTQAIADATGGAALSDTALQTPEAAQATSGAQPVHGSGQQTAEHGKATAATADPATNAAQAAAVPPAGTAAPALADTAQQPTAAAAEIKVADKDAAKKDKTAKTPGTDNATDNAATAAAEVTAPVLPASLAQQPTDIVTTDVATAATDIEMLGTTTALSDATVRSLPVGDAQGDAAVAGAEAAALAEAPSGDTDKAVTNSGDADQGLFALTDTASDDTAPSLAQLNADSSKQGGELQADRAAQSATAASDPAPALKQADGAQTAQVRPDTVTSPPQVQSADAQPAPFQSLLTGAPTGHNQMTAHDASAHVVKVAPQQPVSDAVGIAIGRHVAADNTEFTLRLDPAELGRIEVRLDIGKDGQAVVSVQADNASTFDLLRRDSQALERALADAGLKLDSGGLNFSLRQQDSQARQQFAENNSGPSYGNSGNDGSARGAESAETLRPQRRSASALLDVSI